MWKAIMLYLQRLEEDKQEISNEIEIYKKLWEEREEPERVKQELHSEQPEPSCSQPQMWKEIMMYTYLQQLEEDKQEILNDIEDISLKVYKKLLEEREEPERANQEPHSEQPELPCSQSQRQHAVEDKCINIEEAKKQPLTHYGVKANVVIDLELTHSIFGGKPDQIRRIDDEEKVDNELFDDECEPSSKQGEIKDEICEGQDGQSDNDDEIEMNKEKELFDDECEPSSKQGEIKDELCEGQDGQSDNDDPDVLLGKILSFLKEEDEDQIDLSEGLWHYESVKRDNNDPSTKNIEEREEEEEKKDLHSKENRSRVSYHGNLLQVERDRDKDRNKEQGIKDGEQGLLESKESECIEKSDDIEAELENEEKSVNSNEFAKELDSAIDNVSEIAKIEREKTLTNAAKEATDDIIADAFKVFSIWRKGIGKHDEIAKDDTADNSNLFVDNNKKNRNNIDITEPYDGDNEGENEDECINHHLVIVNDVFKTEPILKHGNNIDDDAIDNEYDYFVEREPLDIVGAKSSFVISKWKELTNNELVDSEKLVLKSADGVNIGIKIYTINASGKSQEVEHYYGLLSGLLKCFNGKRLLIFRETDLLREAYLRKWERTQCIEEYINDTDGRLPSTDVCEIEEQYLLKKTASDYDSNNVTETKPDLFYELNDQIIKNKFIDDLNDECNIITKLYGNGDITMRMMGESVLINAMNADLRKDIGKEDTVSWRNTFKAFQTAESSLLDHEDEFDPPCPSLRLNKDKGEIGNDDHDECGCDINSDHAILSLQCVNDMIHHSDDLSLDSNRAKNDLKLILDRSRNLSVSDIEVSAIFYDYLDETLSIMSTRSIESLQINEYKDIVDDVLAQDEISDFQPRSTSYLRKWECIQCTEQYVDEADGRNVCDILILTLNEWKHFKHNGEYFCVSLILYRCSKDLDITNTMLYILFEVCYMVSLSVNVDNKRARNDLVKQSVNRNITQQYAELNRYIAWKWPITSIKHPLRFNTISIFLITQPRVILQKQSNHSLGIILEFTNGKKVRYVNSSFISYFATENERLFVQPPFIQPPSQCDDDLLIKTWNIDINGGINDYNKLFMNILPILVLFGIQLMIILMAVFVEKVRAVDNLNTNRLLLFVIYVTNMFIIVDVGYSYSLYDPLLIGAAIVCIFIILTTTTKNAYDLYLFIRRWQSDDAHGPMIKTCFNMYKTFVYLLSVLLCSTYAVIQIIISNLFGLSVFSMGLAPNLHQRFSKQRLCVLLLRNIPQITMQTVLTYHSLALLTSIVSILSYIYALCTAFEYNSVDPKCFVCSLRISSVSIERRANSFRNKYDILRRYLFKTFEINEKEERLDLLTSIQYFDTDIGGLTLYMMITTKIDKIIDYFLEEFHDLTKSNKHCNYYFNILSIHNLAENEGYFNILSIYNLAEKEGYLIDMNIAAQCIDIIKYLIPLDRGEIQYPSYVLSALNEWGDSVRNIRFNNYLNDKEQEINDEMQKELHQHRLQCNEIDIEDHVSVELNASNDNKAFEASICASFSVMRPIDLSGCILPLTYFVLILYPMEVLQSVGLGIDDCNKSCLGDLDYFEEETVVKSDEYDLYGLFEKMMMIWRKKLERVNIEIFNLIIHTFSFIVLL